METNLRPRKESEYNPKTIPPKVTDLLATKPKSCPHCRSTAYYTEVEEGSQALYQRLYFFCITCGHRQFPFPGMETKGNHEPNRRND